MYLRIAKSEVGWFVRVDSMLCDTSLDGFVCPPGFANTRWKHEEAHSAINSPHLTSSPAMETSAVGYGNGPIVVPDLATYQPPPAN
jgi:hypothetical protein